MEGLIFVTDILGLAASPRRLGDQSRSSSGLRFRKEKEKNRIDDFFHYQ